MTKPETTEKKPATGDKRFLESTPVTEIIPKPVKTVKDMEVAGYIAEMLIPLRHLAADADTEFLSYLIDMAIEEAHLQNNKKN